MAKQSERLETSRKTKLVAGGQEEAYEGAERQAIALLDQGFRLGGVIHATRDEWHERKDFNSLGTLSLLAVKSR